MAIDRDPTSNNFPNDYTTSGIDNRILLRSKAIREKMYGVDVREALAQGVEISGSVAQNAKDNSDQAQKNVQSAITTLNAQMQTADATIKSMNDLDTQLKNLRTQLQTQVDTMNTTTLPTLNANISAASAKVAQLQQNLNNVDWLSYVKSVNGRKPDSNGNLQVSEYGENLLLNSATMQGTGWMEATQPAGNMEDNGDGTLSYVATGQWKSTRYNFSDLIARNVVAIGDVLTYSEDVFIGDGFTQDGGLFAFGDYLGIIPGKTIVAGSNLIINVGDMKKGWQRISATFTVNNPPTSDDLKNSLRFEFSYIADTGLFKFRKPKLEHGAVATPWCLAPTDNLKALANMYTKAQVDEAIANYVSKYLQTKGN